MSKRTWLAVRWVASCAATLGWIAQSVAGPPPQQRERRTHIRAGFGRTIVGIKPGSAASTPRAQRAVTQYPHPRPRLAGFSPLIAIKTSDEGFPLGHDLEFEHALQSSYVGDPLDPNADPDFVIGILDSGADINLVAGAARDTLGLVGSNLTPNTIPIGGVGGTIDAYITMPVGFFAAGLSAVDANGNLDPGALVGHSNVCGLSAPPIECGNGEALRAVVGMPFMAFYNSIIRVDTPQTVVVGGVTYTGPDVQIQDPIDPLPAFSHRISMEFGGWSAFVTTANYYTFPPEIIPMFPTLLSAFPGSLPLGGAFFATLHLREGDSSNPFVSLRMLVDTGAQSSIISPGAVADLSLPFDPDFTVSVCGVGGLVDDVPGFYVDYAKLSAQGGALEFSQAPFVVLDLPSPELGALDGILGMNFFWNRNVGFEPAIDPNLGPLSASFYVSAPIPFAYGDSDVDFDVDTADAATFVSCTTDPIGGSVNPECTHFDGDDDHDVDLTDFARFQLCFSGSGATADPNCGD